MQMFKKKNSIVHVSIFIAVLGLGILGLIKIIGTRYMSSTRIESSVLNSVVHLVDKALQNQKSCIVTLTQEKIRHKPRPLTNILSANRFVEFSVGSKLTNNFVFENITVQLLDNSETEELVLLKLVFENSKSNVQQSIMKLFSLKKNGTKFVGCRQIYEIRR
jgi:hypothetical protein